MFSARGECPCSAFAAFSYAPYSDRSGLPFNALFRLAPAWIRRSIRIHKDHHPFGIIALMRCGIVSVPEPGFSPYMLAHVRGPDGEGTFLSRLAAGGRSSSLAL